MTKHTQTHFKTKGNLHMNMRQSDREAEKLKKYCRIMACGTRAHPYIVARTQF